MAAAVLFGSALLVGVLRGDGTVAPIGEGRGDPAACVAIGEADARARCYERAFAIVRTEDGDCHFQMHDAGRRAATSNRLPFERFVDRVPNVGTDADCIPGFVHGLVMEAGGSEDVPADELAAGLVRACSQAGAADADRRGCVHGVGHALARREDHSLATVLGACHAAQDGGDCGVGVLHDLSLGSAGIDGAPAAPTPMEDPRSFCRSVVDEYVDSCWLRVLQNQPPDLHHPRAIRRSCADHRRSVATVQYLGCIAAHAAMSALPAPTDWLDRPTQAFAACDGLEMGVRIRCVEALVVPLRTGLSAAGSSGLDDANRADARLLDACHSLDRGPRIACARAVGAALGATWQARGAPTCPTDVSDLRAACAGGARDDDRSWMQYPTAI